MLLFICLQVPFDHYLTIHVEDYTRKRKAIGMDDSVIVTYVTV